MPLSDCTSCELRSTCKAPVPGAGPLPSAVMFVGEAPGKNEDLQGRPFCGMSGQLLSYLISRSGLSRDEVYITNLIKCRPPNNKDPEPSHISACSHWLDWEIVASQAQIIVAVGRFSAWYLLKSHAPMDRLHGLPVTIDEHIILPVYHPAAVLHGDNTKLLRPLYHDFDILKELLKGAKPESFFIPDAFPNPEYADMGNLKIPDCPQMAMDTESVGDTLWSMQISTTPGSAMFFHLPPDIRPQFPSTAEVAVHYYLHESKYSDIPNFVDTMVMAYLTGRPQGLKDLAWELCGMEMHDYSDMVTPYRRDKALNYLQQAASHKWSPPSSTEIEKWDNKAGRVVIKKKKPNSINTKIKKIFNDIDKEPTTDPFDRWHNIPVEERAEVESVLGSMPDSSIADVPFDKALYYASRDADATLRVRDKLKQEISSLGLDFILYCVDQPILPMLQRMMQLGIKIDVDYLKSLSKDLTVRMANKADEASSHVDGVRFNPKSSLQVADLLYGKLKFPVTKRTDGGAPSTHDRELKKINHPVIKPIIQYRELEKIKTTYVEGLLSRADSVDRVHTTFNSTRTDTGRLSSQNPNLQAIPSVGEFAKLVRDSFIAAPGCLLAEIDFSQIEMRTMAHIAQVKGMIKLFQDGRDIHTETAAQVFKIPLEKAKEKKYRYPVKRVGFGIIYGITATGLYELFLEEGVTWWSLKECEKMIDAYYGLYPEISDYQMECAAEARRLGYVKDMFGRIRYIPEASCPIKPIRSAGERQAGNMPVQSAAQVIMKLSMAQLMRDRPDIRYLLQVHDALYLELPIQKVIEEMRYVKGVLENAVTLSVPVIADVKVGERIGDMKAMEL